MQNEQAESNELWIRRVVRLKRMVITCIFIALSSLLTGFSTLSSANENSTKVAIIIDDLGNGLKGTEQIFSLKAPLTVAVMPLLPRSKMDAIRAKQAGFEVILHLPMEFNHGNKRWLGPGAITTQMSTEEIKRQVRKDLDSVPYVVGINNHMGSKATADERVMRAVLEVAKERNLFVVDSFTSPHSKMIPLAKKMGVPHARRTVFLDNVHSRAAIDKQLRVLHTKASQNKGSVAIGHVGLQGDQTAAAIRDIRPVFQRKGVEIVHVSALLE